MLCLASVRTGKTLLSETLLEKCRHRTTLVSLFCLQRDLGRGVSNWKEIFICL